jgi:hypothetical protein
MTRKDYVLLAEALNAAFSRSTADKADKADGIARAAIELADALAADNPRFDRERFLKAAGVTG